MRTHVYIDGFNLYYGCCKRRPGTKWLDPYALCKKLLQPQNQINKIWYFSAEVKARPSSPDILTRQKMYLRALKTLPCLEIELGMFLETQTRMALVNPNAIPRIVDVIKTEEKGSDVNLATRMLVDAFDNQYDTAVVISNDTDLLGPIKIIRSKLGKKVGVLNPQKHPSYALKNEADFYKPIRQGVVTSSQFPDTLSDSMGSFSKPSSW